MSCRSKHLLVFLLEAQRHLAFSSGLQPFVQFVAIYEQMLPLLDDRYPSVFGLVIEGLLGYSKVTAYFLDGHRDMQVFFDRNLFGKIVLQRIFETLDSFAKFAYHFRQVIECQFLVWHVFNI